MSQMLKSTNIKGCDGKHSGTDCFIGNTPKLEWNRGVVTQEHKNLQYLRNDAR